MKKKSILWLLLFVFSIGYSQDAQEIMREYVALSKKNSEYQVNLTYKIYKGHESQTAFETKQGVLYKKGLASYSKVAEAEILSTSTNYVRVNHLERAMLVGPAIAGVSQQFDLNLPELLKYLDVKLLSDNGHYKLEF
ncbi:hypothetical protein, partial [Tenacibaculum xiamenense]|uniref:hypothetical protein n=1 Tax=Tenacibaculum xiamenense TaxID=1261553 RepID=UPI0038B434FB